MDDVVIVGGGIIGAATAYFLSKEGRKVKVIERDPTYKTASFPLSLGGFRRQFFQKENILLGKFAREFIFKIPELLKTEKNPKPTASMVTNGYLLMFGPEHAEEQYRALENHKACDAGTKNIKGSELSKIFPYINNEYHGSLKLIVAMLPIADAEYVINANNEKDINLFFNIFILYIS